MSKIEKNILFVDYYQRARSTPLRACTGTPGAGKTPPPSRDSGSPFIASEALNLFHFPEIIICFFFLIYLFILENIVMSHNL